MTRVEKERERRRDKEEEEEEEEEEEQEDGKTLGACEAHLHRSMADTHAERARQTGGNRSSRGRLAIIT